MNKSSWILAGLLLAGQLLFAQTRLINLEESINLSLQNSKQLKASRAQIEEAEGMVKDARDRRLPDASISGSYLRLANPNINLHSGNDSSSNGGPKISQALYGIANISLPIYEGHRIRYGIESAKYLRQATMLDAENQREEVILNTMNAYTNLYKSTAAAVVIKENLEQSRQRVKDFTNLEKNGLLARNELLKAQLQSSNIELSLLDAENNRKLANINMDLMLGLPEGTELLPDSGHTAPAGTLAGVLEYEQLAIQNRKDILALSFRKKAAETEIKSSRAESYPSIALNGGYIAAYVPNFVTITNAVNVGLGIQYNLSSIWKTGKLQQAKAREKQVAANQEILSDAVRLQVNQSYENYLSSQKKIEVYANAAELATENFRISKNKYDNALLTTTDLLDADVAQLQAKLNYSFAKADAVLAYNKLLQTAGLLNARFKQ
ncbi:MAG TPA: TolC family protein [Ferruginibacter sp.]|nr:TolC family protein [Ferruginibacter sp.]